MLLAADGRSFGLGFFQAAANTSPAAGETELSALELNRFVWLALPFACSIAQSWVEGCTDGSAGAQMAERAELPRSSLPRGRLLARASVEKSTIGGP
jgi:hypothetical protein